MEGEEQRINSILRLSSRACDRSTILLPAQLVLPLRRIYQDKVNEMRLPCLWMGLA